MAKREILQLILIKELTVAYFSNIAFRRNNICCRRIIRSLYIFYLAIPDLWRSCFWVKDMAVSSNDKSVTLAISFFELIYYKLYKMKFYD